MKKLMVLSLLFFASGALALRAADANELWAQNCAKCHGADGKGNTKMGEKLGVKNYTDPKVQDAIKDEKMVKAIKEGVKEGDRTKMKAFTDFTDEEVKALVAHIRSFKK